jgi:hypothetical protein
MALSDPFQRVPVTSRVNDTAEIDAQNRLDETKTADSTTGILLQTPRGI